MINFNYIPDTTKDEQIRAYCIEQAKESSENSLIGSMLIQRADLIEDYIKNGAGNGTKNPGA